MPPSLGSQGIGPVQDALCPVSMQEEYLSMSLLGRLCIFFFFPIPEIQIVRPYPATLQATGWMGSKSGRFEPQITPLMASVCMYIDTVCGVCDV